MASGKPVAAGDASFLVDEDSLFSASVSKKDSSKTILTGFLITLQLLDSFPARGASYSGKKYTCRSERSVSVGYSVAIDVCVCVCVAEASPPRYFE